MPRKLIAIRDTVAQDIAGQPILFHHDAPAIRFFQDVITSNQSVAAHPEDYELVELGLLHDDYSLETTGRIIITGTTIAAIAEGQKNAQLELRSA